ncbi:hypothetical protein Sjap_015393 [Stephania japonica]|uniref:Uncharacterized protein n=1 Tax=Stephania japonica TaxID=461633 RepID=A0AAP0IKL2_9MAGN
MGSVCRRWRCCVGGIGQGERCAGIGGGGSCGLVKNMKNVVLEMAWCRSWRVREGAEKRGDECVMGCG